ncbi:hypothetical protein BD408DRAFT_406066 [Parasitella parasitica]|nr:hypothetical protein BD408DRAFT_406066 [Parasitella parasitica]
MNQEHYYPDTPLEATILNAKYASYQEIVKILTDWAQKNFFELVISKNEKERRVHLRCKLGGETKLKAIAVRQRTRKSLKTNCPYIFKISYSKKAADGSKWKLLKQKAENNEQAHNHPLTLESFQHLPRSKRALIKSETTALVQQMIRAGNSVPEIRRMIRETDGGSILTYDDIRNWKERACTSTNRAFTDGAECDVLYILQSFAMQSFPPVIIEFQRSVTKSYMCRSIQDCINVLNRFYPPYILYRPKIE